MSLSIAQAKEALRQEMKRLRATLKSKKRAVLSEKICVYLENSAEFAQARVIAAYYPTQNEVDILPLLKKAIGAGKKVLLPRVNTSQQLEFVEVGSPTQPLTSFVEVGEYGIFEPLTSLPISSTDQIELVLVPGLAFDRQHHRLGYDKGFYDRFLKTLPEKTDTIGVAFDFQIAKEVPHAEHDAAVKQVITEKERI